MENIYLGKSNKEKLIKEHTEDLLRELRILKAIYPHILNKEEWEILELAIKYHDIGKINSKFQNKLYRVLGIEEILEGYKGEEIPHNFLSPYFINGKYYKEKYGEKYANILISAVYYHHDRKFIDYDAEIAEQIEKDLRKQVENFGDFYGLDLTDIKGNFRRYIIKTNDEQLKSKAYIMIKGLLNKLDYIASLDKEEVHVEEETKEDGKTVAEKVEEIIQEKYDGNYREVQSYMKAKKDENIIVISPCGSGKTEAALLWLEDSKGFYTLPLKVSINSIYERIKRKIHYNKTLLLHSDAFSYYLENEGDSEINAYDRARRLSSPLIITTVDQIFRIVFKYNGYEELLSTFSYSKIIIDEIQMYSPEIIAYILIGLKLITEMGGKFAIMTATFPDVLYEFLKQLDIKYVKQEVVFKPNIEKRHKIKLLKNQDFNIEEIKEKAKSKKVLIIVNTIKKAQQLYQELQNENVHLLHAHYLKKDRKILEDSILEFTDRNKNNDNGIWISTQIVEASLDIDFDILYTEMTSIDSLFQRMGRVYRSRSYLEEMPNVYIVDNKNGIGNIIDENIYEYSLNAIKDFDGELSEENKQKIMRKVFSLSENVSLKKSKYYNKIKDMIRIFKDIRPYSLEKKEVFELFRNINSISLIPDNVYEELNNNGMIDKWKDIFKNGNNRQKVDTKNEINKYAISVTYREYLNYDKEELFYKNSNIYRTSYKYEFDKDKLKGRGLIINDNKVNNFY